MGIHQLILFYLSTNLPGHYLSISPTKFVYMLLDVILAGLQAGFIASAVLVIPFGELGSDFDPKLRPTLLIPYDWVLGNSQITCNQCLVLLWVEVFCFLLLVKDGNFFNILQQYYRQKPIQGFANSGGFFFG